MPHGSLSVQKEQSNQDCDPHTNPFVRADGELVPLQVQLHDKLGVPLQRHTLEEQGCLAAQTLHLSPLGFNSFVIFLLKPFLLKQLRFRK